ncbi:hypothetical protein B7486_20340 [cyanobacterium TDX16]|nr:hypothetical protein B7486_20340 [cyanobacterium TDX16]
MAGASWGVWCFWWFLARNRVTPTPLPGLDFLRDADHGLRWSGGARRRCIRGYKPAPLRSSIGGYAFVGMRMPFVGADFRRGDASI